MIFGLGKKKERCALCGRSLDEHYSTLGYIAQDDDGFDVEVEYAKICSKCADKLDEQDRRLDLEPKDKDVEASHDPEDVEWDDVDGFLRDSLDSKSR